MIGTPTGNSIALNGTTSVTIVPAPAASAQNIVTKVTAFNGDTVARDITVRITISGTHYPVEKKTALAAGASYSFSEVAKHTLDATTKTLTAVADAAPATTNPTITVAYIVNT